MVLLDNKTEIICTLTKKIHKTDPSCGCVFVCWLKWHGKSGKSGWADGKSEDNTLFRAEKEEIKEIKEHRTPKTMASFKKRKKEKEKKRKKQKGRRKRWLNGGER